MSVESQNTVDGLECPNCFYNLTGLSENRCPECGERFDPDRLRRLSSPEVLPATPWNDVMGISGYVATWILSVRLPREIARNFPARHDTYTAILYSAVSYLSAAAIFFVATILTVPAVFVLEIVAGAILAVIACESIMAATLAGLARPTHARLRYHFWRGQIRYTSGYTLLTACWGGFCINAEAVDFGSWLLCLLSAVAIFLLWCRALWESVSERSRPGSGRTCAYLLIPVIGIASIIGGFYGTALLVMLTLF